MGSGVWLRTYEEVIDRDQGALFQVQRLAHEK